MGGGGLLASHQVHDFQGDQVLDAHVFQVFDGQTKKIINYLYLISLKDLESFFNLASLNLASAR